MGLNAFVLGTDGGDFIVTHAGDPILIAATSETPDYQPLQTIIPSYLYQEYADDQDLQAFVDAYNELAQGYLDWFNQTPLSVYTSPAVSGPLLDWVGNGIWGIPRPVFGSTSSKYVAALNTYPMNTLALNGSQMAGAGSAIPATDDYYKRVLTWYTYLGDGRHFTVPVLRKKVARFLFGANGTDITLSLANTVGVTASGSSIAITLPNSPASPFFKQAFAQGLLPVPFQLSFTVGP